MMETSAKEWAKCPAMGELWETERRLIDAHMSGLSEADAVLDLACGTGQSTSYVATTYGCTAVGSDIMAGLVEMAQSKYGGDRVTFITGDMCDPGHVADRQGTFSWVMCHHGIQMVNDMEGFMETCTRSLRSGGHLLINCVTRQLGDPLFVMAVHRAIKSDKWREHRTKMEATLKAPMFTMTPPEGHWIKDMDVLLRLVERHGFTLLHKELCRHTFTVPVIHATIRSVFGCVKVLPADRQEEFLNDVVQHGRDISGQENPVAKMNTVVVLAKMTS